jgi:NNP family nitrate/nitrite transporter-like MFS transporter
MAVVFARFGAGGRFHGAPPHWGVLRELTGNRRFWIIAFFFIMAIGLELGVYSMLPTYLIVDRELERSLVNSIVSSSRLTSLLAVFLAGWLTDRFGVRHVIGGVALGAGAVTAALGFTDGWLLVTAVYLQPMLISAFFPAGLSALAGLGTAERRNLSVSVMIPLAYLFGAGMIPAIIGRLAEADAFGLGFVGVGLLMAAGTVLTTGLRRVAPEG